MSSDHSDWEVAHRDMDPVERQKQEGEGWVFSSRTGEEALGLDASPSEGRASTPRSECSDSDGEDKDKDEGGHHSGASDGGESGDEHRDGECSDGDYSHCDHSCGEHSQDEDSHDESSHDGDSHDEDSHDEDSHDEENCGSGQCQHSHDNKSNDGSNGNENYTNEQKFSMAVKNHAGALREYSTNKPLSVLLRIHFKDSLIDYSRRHTSQLSITDNSVKSTIAELQGLQLLKTLFDTELAKLVVGVDPFEGAMSRHKRSTLLRYTVHLKFFVDQDRVQTPLVQFNHYNTEAISGGGALELIKDIDEIVADALVHANDLVASKDIIRYDVENCFCDDDDPSSLLPAFDAMRILEMDRRIADKETEAGRATHAVQNDHAHTRLRPYEAACSDNDKPCDGCGAAHSHAYGRAPSGIADSSS